MIRAIGALVAITVLVVGVASLNSASAQFQQGGVNHPGEWYTGESLQIGDLFYYELCHVDYRECVDFEMAVWMKGEVQVGNETLWLAQTVVRDGNKLIIGDMRLGKVDAAPTDSDENINSYRSAFKSSISWLSAFATMDSPQKFNAVSWGKIANIGGEQIVPKEIITRGVTIPGGSFAGANFESRHFDDVVMIGWKTGGIESEVYIADDFPFPVWASTWTHVSSGIPPQEYKFRLLGYQTGIFEDPFTESATVCDPSIDPGCDPSQDCPSIDALATTLKKPTEYFMYQIHVLYAPEFPVQGCPMKMQIKFINKFNDAEIINNIQYDLRVLDENEAFVRSLASDEGRPFLFSPSGQALFEFIVEEEPGMADYVILVHGAAPKHIRAQDMLDYLRFEVPIAAAQEAAPPDPVIPAWIKTTVGFWVDDISTDAEFISAMQFLIREGVITVTG